MASRWNLWVWLQCIGVASRCCCKEVRHASKKTLHTVVLRRRHSGTTVNKTRLSDGLATLTAVTTVQDKHGLIGRTKIAVWARANW